MNLRCYTLSIGPIVKLLLRTLIVLLAAIAATSIAFLTLPRLDAPHAGIISGTYEQPSERTAWEARRLADPATGRIPEGIRRRELAFAATLPLVSSAHSLAGSSGVERDWVWRGPANIGGRTRTLVIDVSGEDTILAGGISGGIFRSSDGGENWTMTTLASQLPSITSLAQDVRVGHRHIWYAATGELLGNSASADGAYYFGDGVLKSIDNGRSWQPIASVTSGTPHIFDRITDAIWRVATDPANNDTDKVYLAAYNSILRSINGGETFTQVLTGSTNSSYYTDIAVASDGTVYATMSSDGNRRGIHRSVNGRNFVNIVPDSFPSDYRRIVVGIAPSDVRTVYFLAETPGAGHLGRNFQGDSIWASLWRYTYDSGNGSGTGGKWVDLSANMPSFGGSFGDYNPQSSYDMHVQVHPTNPNIVYIGGTNLYRSTDGFTSQANTSWIGGYRDIPITNNVIVPLHYPNHHPDLHWLTFSPTNPSVIYTGSDGGIHRSDNGEADSVEWTDLNRGYRTTQFYTVAIDRGTPGSNFIVGGMQDNGTWSTSTDDSTVAWQQRGSGDGSYCDVADGGRTIYVSKQNAKSYRVDLDVAGTMTGFARIDPIGLEGYDFINPFTLDPNDQRVLYMAGGKYLWRNSDATAVPVGTVDSISLNWLRLDATLRPDTISTISVAPVLPAGRVWYGTNRGSVLYLDGAGSSAPVVKDVTSQSFPRNAHVNCIAVDLLDGARAIVVFSNYAVVSLFSTTDAGETWMPIAGNLEQNANGTGSGPSCRWAAIVHRDIGPVYLVGTSTGLYSTTMFDSASTVWQQEGAQQIGNVVVSMIRVRPSDGRVLIATHGRGIFSSVIPVTSGVVHERSAATVGSLKRISPNIIRSAAIVELSLTQGAAREITIKLVDMRGTLIAELHRGPSSLVGSALPIRIPRSTPPGRYYVVLRDGWSVESLPIEVVR